MKLTTPTIQAVLGFPELAPLELLQAATAIYTGTNGNPDFPNPTVDLAVLKAHIDNFSSAITASLDGGKKAIAERNRLAEVLIKGLTPGTNYFFQVRSLTGTIYSEWSDSVVRICT